METNSVATLIALPLALSPAAYIVERLNRKIHPGWLALLILALAWGVFGIAAYEFDRDGTLTYRVGMMQLQLDGLSLFACCAILTLGTLTVIYSLDYMAEEGAADKYYALVLLLLGTMMGLVCTRDLFNLWVWFEAMAISASFLVAFYREQPASLEAGVKYIVQSALGSAFIL
ncbi:partial Na(+)/H(+) antiporter subunit A, partial [Anaerolineae bacterium]